MLNVGPGPVQQLLSYQKSITGGFMSEKKSMSQRRYACPVTAAAEASSRRNYVIGGIVVLAAVVTSYIASRQCDSSPTSPLKLQQLTELCSGCSQYIDLECDGYHRSLRQASVMMSPGELLIYDFRVAIQEHEVEGGTIGANHGQFL